MGGSGVSKAENNQDAIAQQQANTATQYGQLAQQALGQMNSLYQPAIAADTSLINAANAGNYSQMIAAAGPQVGTIGSQFAQAKQNIQNSVPSGAGQQAALAQLPAQQASQTAGVLNQTYTNALGQLAQLGASYGGVGLQEGSLQNSNLTGAANTYGQVGQEAASSKASTMGLLGSIAGAGATGFAGR